MFDAIVAPINGEEPGTSALRLAARMAVQDSARLVILYASPVNPPPEHLRTMAEQLGFLDAIEEDLDAVEVTPSTVTLGPGIPVLQYPEGFEARWGECMLGWARSVALGEGVDSAECILASGEPAQAVCEHVRSSAAGLVVMGSRGRGKLGSLLLGSVSQSVLERCECPCLIVK